MTKEKFPSHCTGKNTKPLLFVSKIRFYIGAFFPFFFSMGPVFQKTSEKIQCALTNGIYISLRLIPFHQQASLRPIVVSTDWKQWFILLDKKHFFIRSRDIDSEGKHTVVEHCCNILQNTVRISHPSFTVHSTYGSTFLSTPKKRNLSIFWSLLKTTTSLLLVTVPILPLQSKREISNSIKSRFSKTKPRQNV